MQENMQNTVQENVQENQVQPKTKRKGVLPLFICLILLALIIVFGYFFYQQKTESKNIFKTGIHSVFTNLKKQVVDLTTTEGTYHFSADIDTPDSSNQIFDIIDKIDLSGTYKIDFTNKIMNLRIESNYDDKKLVNGNLYFEKDNGYIYLEGIYDKYLSVPIEDYDSIFQVNRNTKAEQQVLTSLENAIVHSLKDEYFTEEIEDGNHKTTLKVTKEVIDDIAASITKTLKSDEEFLNSYGNITSKTSDEVKKELDDTLSEVTESEESNNTIYISIYTKGVSRKFVKMTASDDDVNEVQIIKNDDTYNLEFNESDKVIASASITIDGSNYKIVMEDKTSNTKIELDMGATMNLGNKIDKTDVSNSVLLENMSQEELMGILTKISENEGFVEIINAINSFNSF